MLGFGVMLTLILCSWQVFQYFCGWDDVCSELFSGCAWILLTCTFTHGWLPIFVARYYFPTMSLLSSHFQSSYFTHYFMIFVLIILRFYTRLHTLTHPEIGDPAVHWGEKTRIVCLFANVCLCVFPCEHVLGSHQILCRESNPISYCASKAANASSKSLWSI